MSFAELGASRSQRVKIFSRLSDWNMRQSPNIIITGTPGVGKTTHCESLAERTGLRHVSINQIVKDKECHEGWSEEYQSWIVDEDKVSSLIPLLYEQSRGSHGGRSWINQASLAARDHECLCPTVALPFLLEE
jgi:hypothetical protein